MNSVYIIVTQIMITGLPKIIMIFPIIRMILEKQEVEREHEHTYKCICMGECVCGWEVRQN